MELSFRKYLIIFRKTDGKCFYCGAIKDPIEMVIDHFMSKQKYKEWKVEDLLGSPDEIENLVLACTLCNSSKKDKCPEDFTGLGEVVWDLLEKANKKVGLY